MEAAAQNARETARLCFRRTEVADRDWSRMTCRLVLSYVRPIKPTRQIWTIGAKIEIQIDSMKLLALNESRCFGEVKSHICR
jgi:hypothetical protein